VLLKLKAFELWISIVLFPSPPRVRLVLGAMLREPPLLMNIHWSDPGAPESYVTALFRVAPSAAPGPPAMFGVHVVAVDQFPAVVAI
jgi:hypothetical protein